ncbi:hypothetical protein NFHSH190041_25560 [Shewanella sp. NFH-SH190041]|uniref:VF530 family protein n=1 Tax=Shewanella sp. NFH-SH190041 TaxID=2950245 RepID=UPI0021C37CCB|nr:VF530 family protein [Shewanella sp. NFH-SH190041]BDM65104.1 hypothetical protein NFHSH190041_25560 [Shewanella sp. NFH-SH190041]
MTQANNPLHGIKLETLLTELVDAMGWEALGSRINILCFTHDPSIKSSLKFLRKQQWARDKVEQLYLRHKGVKQPRPPRRDNDHHATSSQTPRRPQASKTPQRTASDPTKQINAQVWGTR